MLSFHQAYKTVKEILCYKFLKENITSLWPLFKFIHFEYNGFSLTSYSNFIYHFDQQSHI